MTPPPFKKRHHGILKIVFIYVLFGLFWIYTSDTVLGWFVSEPKILVQLAIFKGSVFIILTSFLLYFLIRQYDKKTVLSEQAVIASEKRFEELFQKLADPIYISDINGMIIAANDQACRELGCSLEEILQLRVSDIDTSEDVDDLFEANLSLLERSPSKTFETNHRRKDGSVFPVEVNVSLIDLAGQPAVMGIARNISKRKRMADCLTFLAQAAAVPAEEDFFHRLARYLASTLDMDYICIDSLEPGDLSAKTIALFADGQFEDNIAYTLKDTPCGEVVENKVCCYPKGVRHFFPRDAVLEGMEAESYLGTILWGTNGEEIGLIAAIGRKPLTDSEEAEEILQLVSVRAAAELERTIYDAERLHLEKQILHAQKLESLGVLAGGIAHDFNNILTAIMGNANLALMRINKESPVVDNLHRIEQASAKAADLANQMLAYAGRGKFHVESLDLNLLLKEMIHMLEISISKKVLLRFNPATNLPSIEADATQIRQIIMNLVINASEAISDTGSVVISTGCVKWDPSDSENMWLADNLTQGLYVYLEVADTGCGMESETMMKIFDPFFSTKFAGRGLGMAAVLGIVQGHKGAIKIASESGKGTIFKVFFPASSEPVKISTQEGKSDNWRGSGIVLLVDDEEDVRNIGKEMLHELGFSSITANSGAEAIDIFKNTGNIKFVVLDLTMPHMDGEQCLLELRRLKPDIKVVLSSGYNKQEVPQRIFSDDLTQFIHKPYKLSDLKKTILELKES